MRPKERRTLVGWCSVSVLVVTVLAFSGCVGQDSGSENRIPVAAIQVSSMTPNQFQQVNFSGLGSYDPDGTVTVYHWDFGDGSTSWESVVKHAYDTCSVFNVTLTITDDRDAKAVSNTTITVNGIPKAKASVDKTRCKVNEPIHFNSDGSLDPEMQPLKYQWNFGDSAISSSADPVYSYNDIGNYTVTLTVSDERGAKDSTTLNIEVVSRQYQITWERRNSTPTDFNGYTREGTSNNKTESASQTDLVSVDAVLEWSDDLPVNPLDRNASQDADDFQLTVKSPLQRDQTKNSSQGRILISFKVGNLPKSFKVTASDESDALQQAQRKCPDSRYEDGNWFMQVSALNCTGGLLVNGVMELDQGNSWTLTFNYQYYEAVATEI
jgi:PKD repeat protein